MVSIVPDPVSLVISVPPDCYQIYMDDEVRFPHSNITAVTDLSEYLATTYGPVGMDKLIVTELESEAGADPHDVGIDDYLVTSDGAEILRKLPFQHPAGSLIEGIIGFRSPGETDTEGEYIPDGIAGSVIVTAALLEEAIGLIDDGIHPTDVQHGYNRGLSEALDSIAESTVNIPDGDTHEKVDLSLAKTAMTGADVDGQRTKWAELAVEAVAEIGMPDEYTLPVRRIGTGHVTDSTIIRGVVLDRSEIAHQRMPTSAEDASILVLGGFERETASDGRSGGLRDPTPVESVSLQVEDLDDIEDVNRFYRERRHSIVQELIRKDIDVVVTELGITPDFQELLADAGIIGIRGVHSLKLAQLAKASGARIVKDPTDIRREYCGTVGFVEERRVHRIANRRKRRRIVVFEDCTDPDSVTVKINGAIDTAQEEIAREIRKAAKAIALAQGEGPGDAGYIPGGGGIDMKIASDVRNTATALDDRTQIVMKSFARAVEEPVRFLAENGGLDPLSTIANLRSEVIPASARIGVRLPDGEIDDVVDAGIIEPSHHRRSIYIKSVGLANRILRIDDALDADLE